MKALKRYAKVDVNVVKQEPQTRGSMFRLTANLFQSISCPERAKDIVARRSYGVIEVRDQELYAIHFRPYPKLVSVAEIEWAKFWKRSATTTQNDRVLLYYNQPVLCRNFLALKYFISDYKSTLASIAVCLSVLDYVAMLKKTDAIVTEITNRRIKDRHLSHFGWDEHMHGKRGRHWIKRFYGQYAENYLFQELQLANQQPTEAGFERSSKLVNPVVFGSLENLGGNTTINSENLAP